MKGIYLDPETEFVKEQFAVVFAPRRNRNRFAENCVEVMESRQAALDSADPDNNHYAAKVVGPSRSSEGLRLYYIVQWLE